MTADLIDRLTAELRPTPRHAVARRIGGAVAVSGLVSVVIVVFGMGMRPDIAGATGTSMFWVKLGYTGLLALAGASVAERLARPLGGIGRAAWGLLPLAGIVLLGAWQWAAAPPALRDGLVMGTSAAACPWLIVVTGTPVFAGLVWALRGLAPTRLALAGLCAGLTAGAAGAMAYALHCPEAGAPFVAIWYTLGIALTGAAGWLLGPRLLRW